MSAERGYDGTALNALRQELKRLNEAALADGLVASRDGRIEMPSRPRRKPFKRRSAGSANSEVDKKQSAGPSPNAGKAASRRLLTMGARIADDKSLAVPGTEFTEAGVTRLLATLRRPRRRRVGAWHRFRQQIERYLSRPVSSGLCSAAGVSVERLQVLSRQLHEIDRHGWSRFQEKRANRRRRTTATGDQTS